MKKRQGIKTKHKDIFNYWKERMDWLDEYRQGCFCCGSQHSLDRAHIIPASRGGEDSVDNLVILCKRCHKNAPDVVINKDILLNWIEREAETYNWDYSMKWEKADEYCTARAKALYGLAGGIGDNIDFERAVKSVQEYVNENVVYAGFGHHEAYENSLIELFKYLQDNPQPLINKYFECK